MYLISCSLFLPACIRLVIVVSIQFAVLVIFIILKLSLDFLWEFQEQFVYFLAAAILVFSPGIVEE